MAASSGSAGICVMHNDVSRAYFHAPAVREVFVEIVSEDFDEGDEGMCGKLNLSMYGTRDAASNWEAAYSGQLKKWVSSKACRHHACFITKVKKYRLSCTEMIFSAWGAKLA